MGCTLDIYFRSIQDAWLDNVEVDTRFVGKFQPKSTAEEVYEDLSSDDIGKIKRRIADALQPGETVTSRLMNYYFC